jgi:hypothetical protein
MVSLEHPNLTRRVTDFRCEYDGNKRLGYQCQSIEGYLVINGTIHWPQVPEN